MPLSPAQRKDSNIAGVLGTLALSAVRPGAPTMALRALRWFRDLEKLGVRLPFSVVHDIGLLLAVAPEHYAIAPRTDPEATLRGAPGGQQVCDAYLSLIRELSECEAARRAASLRLSDDMIGVVLSKLLGAVSSRIDSAPAYGSAIASDAALFDGIDNELVGLYQSRDRTYELHAIATLTRYRLYVLTIADALDLDTLQLLGVLGAEAGTGVGLQVDLLAAMASPAAHDVVNFSLEILPSVLETKTRPGASTRAGFGCGGLGTRGSIDNLVLTELAWDAEDFTRRIIDNEVLYYTKETEREPAGRRHVLLIDASASMRGDRQVFARGMALATAKKLVLEGEDVSIRFFDSRLYEAQSARGGNLPTPYVLSFKGERGRNPARVFSELSTALDIEMVRDHREVVLHVFTHAALYIPRELIQTLTKQAKVGIVFILPSGGSLDLDYLDLLDTHWVVDHETLNSQGARADKARDILGEIGERDEEQEAEGRLSVTRNLGGEA
ncbi:MAG: hypothetical protein ACOC1F_00560 [Myxococcota bacterium]